MFPPKVYHNRAAYVGSASQSKPKPDIKLLSMLGESLWLRVNAFFASFGAMHACHGVASKACTLIAKHS